MHWRVIAYTIFISLFHIFTFSQASPENSWPLNNVLEGRINEIAKQIISSFHVEISKLKAPLEFSYNHSEYVPTPLISSAELKIRERWDERSQSSKPYYKIELLGVYTRVSTMTEDGIALILCHELGHALGGKPRFLQIYSGLSSALSAEGQADYFAATSCFKRFVQSSVKSSDKPLFADPIVKTKCTAKYLLDREKIEICERTAMAGAAVLLSLNKIRAIQGQEVMSFSFKMPSK